MLKKTLAVAAATAALVAATAAPAQAALTMFYAGVQQTVTDSLAFANASVHKPTVTAGDFHSLGEVAVTHVNGSGNREIVEVGWNVDQALYGNADPHLFVFWWKNGVGCGYNATNTCGGSGFVPWAGSSPYPAGFKFTSPYPNVRLMIQHSGTAWWVATGVPGGTVDWIGYFPDSNWSTAWSSFDKVQVFGEVAANVAAPTTQMGNGVCPTTTAGAFFSSITYSAGTPINLVTTGGMITNPAKYALVGLSAGNRSFRYGGDGSCP